MWTDKGREFFNKDVNKLVELYSTENEETSCVFERFKRTIKEIFFKYFSANNTRKYIYVLDLLADQYNNAIHSSIIMTLKEASRKENEIKVWRNLYPESCGKTLAPKSSIGIQLTIPVTYTITDYNGVEIQGSFYEQELQKTKQDMFRKEKKIKQQGNKSLVKFLGYNDSFNSWVDNKDINKL